jgi:hypothetical protein
MLTKYAAVSAALRQTELAAHSSTFGTAFSAAVVGAVQSAHRLSVDATINAAFRTAV